MRFAAWLLLLLLVALLHLAAQRAQPEPRLFGDELHYLKQARQDLLRDELGLLPGSLRFDARPELYSRLLAHFLLAGGEGPGPGRRKLTEAPDPAVLARIAWAQLGLLIALLLLVQRQARLLGLGPAGGLTAAALLGLFPWFGFYVQALWPELLHAALFALALWALLAWQAGGQRAWLLLAGAALGPALLTKGTLNGFLPLLALWVAALAFRRGGERPWSAAGAALGLVALPLLAVIVPQLAANRAAGHGLRLSANHWWNVELGLRSTLGGGLAEPTTEGPGHWGTEPELTDQYKAAADDWVERDRLSRERTLAHLRAAGLGQLPVQLRKVGYLFLREPSFFEQALGEELGRWGSPPPGWLAALRLPARAIWYGLLVLGALGLLLGLRRGPGWWLLAAFALFVLAGILVVPTKTRFLMPLVPFLCLGAGGVVDTLARAASARRAAPGDPSR